MSEEGERAQVGRPMIATDQNTYVHYYRDPYGRFTSKCETDLSKQKSGETSLCGCGFFSLMQVGRKA